MRRSGIFPTSPRSFRRGRCWLFRPDDGLAPATDALIANLHTLKDNRVTAVHLPTDHVYSGQRIALQSAVVSWLGTLN